MRRRRFILPVLALALTALAPAAHASLPVAWAIVGCIKEGKFWFRGAAGPAMSDPALNQLEGRTVRVEGYLSPGDLFSANAVFVVDDQCRDDMHKTYFLCDPCQTLPNQPPSKPAPRQESGRPIELPSTAIRLFNLLPRALERKSP